MASILELSSTARKYYEKLRAKSVYHGWEKYVLTNGEESMFVDASYEPVSGEAVFLLQTRSGQTMVELKKGGK